MHVAKTKVYAQLQNKSIINIINGSDVILIFYIYLHFGCGKDKALFHNKQK